MNDKPILSPIPGGTARFKHPKDVTERRRRPIKIRATMLGTRRIAEIYNALPRSTDEIDPDALATELKLTATEAELVFDLQDLSVLAALDSWTLDRPLPTTVEELQDLPAELYDALSRGAAQKAATGLLQEILQGDGDEQFSVGAAGDKASPTGPSGDSAVPSTPEGD